MQRPSAFEVTGVASFCFSFSGSGSCATAEPTQLPRALSATAWNANLCLLCNGRAILVTTGVVSYCFLFQFCSPIASPVAWVCSARLFRSLRQRPSVKTHSVVDLLCFAFSLEFWSIFLDSSWLHIFTSKYHQIASIIRKTPKKNQSKSNWHKWHKTTK